MRVMAVKGNGIRKDNSRVSCSLEWEWGEETER